MNIEHVLWIENPTIDQLLNTEYHLIYWDSTSHGDYGGGEEFMFSGKLSIRKNVQPHELYISYRVPSPLGEEYSNSKYVKIAEDELWRIKKIGIFVESLKNG